MGVYAVARRAVDERATELALRRALGAGAGRLAAGVALREGGFVALGVAVALPVTMVVVPQLGLLLYATSPLEARVWLEGALAVVLAALIAVIPSALRAAGTDPAAIMRV